MLPGQGFFGQIPPPTNPPERRRRTHEATWTRLDETIPKTDEEWRVARHRHHFDTPELIIRTLTRLLDPSEKESLYTIVFLASCLVESYATRNKAKSFSDIRTFFGKPDLAEVTLDRYMKSVARLVTSLDQLCMDGLLHRAYESILYIPNQLSHLRQYGEQPERFRSLFVAQRPQPEIQGSVVLYIPFLVHLKRPDLSLFDICESLDSRLFHEDEYAIFRAAVDDQILAERLPSPLMPPVASHPSPQPRFEIFELPESIQLISLNAGQYLRGFHSLPPGIAVAAEFYGYEWTSHHRAVVDAVVQHLVDLGKIPPHEYAHLGLRAIHHESGSIQTPTGQFQIIIPITETSGERLISVGADTLGNEWLTWDIKFGFLLKEGTSLLTDGSIDYISVVSPYPP